MTEVAGVVVPLFVGDAHTRQLPRGIWRDRGQQFGFGELSAVVVIQDHSVRDNSGCVRIRNSYYHFNNCFGSEIARIGKM